MPDPTQPLFGYTFVTDPPQLGVSTPQVPASGRLDVGVTAPAAGAACRQIRLAVPVEPGDGALFTTAPAGSVSTDRWSVAAETMAGAQVGTWAAADAIYTVLTYSCRQPADETITYPLVLGVSGTVATRPANAQVLIAELSADTLSGPFAQKYGEYGIGTTWPEFYLENLVATALPPADPTVPCTTFPAGAPIRLGWESNGDYFEVYAGSSATPAWSGTATTCTLAAGCSVDTTLILVASRTGPPGLGSASSGYEPVYRHTALTVTVSDPALTPSSVAVAHDLTVGGSSTISAVSAGDVQATSLASSGGLTVSGLTTLTDLAATGTVAAIQLPDALANEQVDQDIGPVTFQFPTDGYAVLQLLPEPTYGAKPSWVYGLIFVRGMEFRAMGGARWQDGYWAPAVGSLTVPVPANTQWELWLAMSWYGGTRSPNPAHYILSWIPLGVPPQPS
jgi:hypothetical protein